MNPRPCTECGAPIVWGKRPGAKVTPVAVDARGPYLLLDERFLFSAPARSWDELPAETKAEIPPSMVEKWKAALDGPRYSIHSAECRRNAALRLKQKDAVG